MASLSGQDAATRCLECARCHSQFELTNARTLSCHHAFCRKCLKALITGLQNDKQPVCPICYKVIQWLKEDNYQELFLQPVMKDSTDSDVGCAASAKMCEDCDNLEERPAIAFCEDCQLLLCESCVSSHRRSKRWRKHSILEMADYEKRQLQGFLGASSKECGTHPEEQLTTFCKKCNEVICGKCATEQHRNCSLRDLSQEGAERRSAIHNLMEQIVTDTINPLKTAVLSTRLQREKVIEVTSACKQAVTKHFLSVEGLLRKRQHDLFAQIDKLHQSQVEFLQQRRKYLMADLQRTLLAADIAKHSITSGKKSTVVQAAAFVTDTGGILDRSQQLKLWCPPAVKTASLATSFANTLSRSITLKTSRPQPILDNVPDLFLLHVPGNFLVRSFADFGKPAVSVVNNCGDDYPSAVVSLSEVSAGSNNYHVSVTTKTPGEHSVIIGSGSFRYEFEELSFTVPSLAIPDMASKMIGHFGNDPETFCSPHGINRCGDHFLVADYSTNTVKEVNCSGDFIGRFMWNGLLPVAAVLHPSERIFATGEAMNQVVSFSRHGEGLGWFGGTLDKPSHKLQGPRGINTLSNGHLVISEYDGHRIHILEIDGSTVKLITHRNLQQPMFLTVDQTNDNILVANAGGHTIEEFTKDGKHVQSIGHSHCAQSGQLNRPTGVTLHPSGHILVADSGNHRVCIFSREGEYAGVWATMNSPMDVSCSKEGHVFVTQLDAQCGLQIYYLQNQA